MLTYKCTRCRERIILSYKTHCICISSFINKRDISRNINSRRAQCNTRYCLGYVIGTFAIFDMCNIIVTETFKPPEYHIGCLISDCTVSRVTYYLSKPFYLAKRLHCCLSFKNLIKVICKLSESYTARHTFTACLCMA